MSERVVCGVGIQTLVWVGILSVVCGHLLSVTGVCAQPSVPGLSLVSAVQKFVMTIHLLMEL